MATILAILFGATTGICGVGWLIARISTKAVILFFLGKGSTPPTEEEMEVCCKEAIRRMFGLKP